MSSYSDSMFVGKPFAKQRPKVKAGRKTYIDAHDNLRVENWKDVRGEEMRAYNFTRMARCMRGIA